MANLILNEAVKRSDSLSLLDDGDDDDEEESTRSAGQDLVESINRAFQKLKVLVQLDAKLPPMAVSKH